MHLLFRANLQNATHYVGVALNSCYKLFYKHRIPEAEETITLLNSCPAGMHNMFFARQCERRGIRSVDSGRWEIGNERINAFEFVARIDGSSILLRHAWCRLHPPRIPVRVYGDDSAAAFFCIIVISVSDHTNAYGAVCVTSSTLTGREFEGSHGRCGMTSAFRRPSPNVRRVPGFQTPVTKCFFARTNQCLPDIIFSSLQ